MSWTSERLLETIRALVGSMLRELMQGVNDGSLKPLPLRVFSSGEVVSAFRHMQQAKHIGKIVIVPEKPADQDAVAQSDGVMRELPHG